MSRKLGSCRLTLGILGTNVARKRRRPALYPALYPAHSLQVPSLDTRVAPGLTLLTTAVGERGAGVVQGSDARGQRSWWNEKGPGCVSLCGGSVLRGGSVGVSEAGMAK